MINADVEGSGVLVLRLDGWPLKAGDAAGVLKVEGMSAEDSLTRFAAVLDFFFLVMSLGKDVLS